MKWTGYEYDGEDLMRVAESFAACSDNQKPHGKISVVMYSKYQPPSSYGAIYYLLRTYESAFWSWRLQE